MSQTLLDIYSFLLHEYGRQGWWPLINYGGCNPTKTGSVTGYHPGHYELPETRDQVFEICLGAILTQNTGWPQVEKALRNLHRANGLNPEGILNMDIETLKEHIKPAGYFNQKAQKVTIFTRFFSRLGHTRIPDRRELLDLWGIGPETADSMLLYAFKVPTFVVDAYTRRIFSHLKFIHEKSSYDQVKLLFEENLPRDLIVYQEFHALIVEHAKRFYHKGGSHKQCPLFLKGNTPVVDDQGWLMVRMERGRE